jgi:hypothetical protein
VLIKRSPFILNDCEKEYSLILSNDLRNAKQEGERFGELNFKMVFK